MCSLYILDINPLSDISFVDIFFHSVEMDLSILLMASFTAEKLWTLISYHLFIFAFLALVAEIDPKNKYC